jgi:hypothetical protein
MVQGLGLGCYILGVPGARKTLRAHGAYNRGKFVCGGSFHE